MYMNLAYRYIVTQGAKNQASLYPYIDSWSHHSSTTELQRVVNFPDKPIISDQVLHVEGDFTREFTKNGSAFDVVTTLFFIDTARNLLRYFETIKTALKPGGLWINVGPLLYGSAPFIELSLDEILAVCKVMGFEFIQTDNRWGNLTIPGETPRGKGARYGSSPRSLSKDYLRTSTFSANPSGRKLRRKPN